MMGCSRATEVVEADRTRCQRTCIAPRKADRQEMDAQSLRRNPTLFASGPIPASDLQDHLMINSHCFKQ